MSCVDRLEFDKRTKLEMFLRAGGPGNLRCEGCGLLLRGKRFDYDHEIEEWERNEPKHLRRPLTANDGKVLGYDCCHKDKSGRKAGERAHGKRIVEKMARVRAKAPFPGGRNSRWKRKVSGEVVPR